MFISSNSENYLKRLYGDFASLAYSQPVPVDEAEFFNTFETNDLGDLVEHFLTPTNLYNREDPVLSTIDRKVATGVGRRVLSWGGGDLAYLPEHESGELYACPEAEPKFFMSAENILNEDKPSPIIVVDTHYAHSDPRRVVAVCKTIGEPTTLAFRNCLGMGSGGVNYSPSLAALATKLAKVARTGAFVVDRRGLLDDGQPMRVSTYVLPDSVMNGIDPSVWDHYKFLPPDLQKSGLGYNAGIELRQKLARLASDPTAKVISG